MTKVFRIQWLVVLILLQMSPKIQARTLFIPTKINTTNNGDFDAEARLAEKETNKRKDEGEQSLQTLIEKLLLKSQLKANDEPLSTLIPLNYYNKTKADFENKTKSKLVLPKSIRNAHLRDVKEAEIAREEPKNQKFGKGNNNTPITGSQLHELENESRGKRFDNQGSSVSDEHMNATVFNATGTTVNDKISLSNTSKLSLKKSEAKERHAPATFHIYRTAEQASNHPIDRLSVDVKNIGGNETLKEQLDFLQNNAENIMKQLHVVGESEVNINARNESREKAAMSSENESQTNTATNGDVSAKESGIRNKLPVKQVLSANEAFELPKPLHQPSEEDDDDEEAPDTGEFGTVTPSKSYLELSSSSEDFDDNDDEAKDKSPQVAPTNTIEKVVKIQRLQTPPVKPSESTEPVTFVNNISSPKERLKLPKPQFVTMKTNEQTDGSYMISNTEKLSKTNQNQRKVETTANAEVEESEVFNKPVSQLSDTATPSSKVNFLTAANESLELPKPLTLLKVGNELELISNATLQHTHFTSSNSNLDLKAESSLFRNASNHGVDGSSKYSASNKSTTVSALIQSKPVSYAMQEQLPSTLQAASVDDDFMRLRDIFVEYAIPISSVVKQLSDEFVMAPEERTRTASIEPTKLNDDLHFSKAQTVNQMHERPDPVVDGETSVEQHSADNGYGADYAILQSQAKFTIDMNNSSKEGESSEESSIERESSKESSNEPTSTEVEYSEAACNETCTALKIPTAAQNEIKAPASLMTIDQTPPAMNYQSNESNESESEVNYISASDEAFLNTKITNFQQQYKSTSESVVDATALSLPQYSYLITNEQTNHLYHLEMATENSVNSVIKEIENIDKTNDTQVESGHFPHHHHLHYYLCEDELPSENKNDMSSWKTAATGLQHISTTRRPQLNAAPEKVKAAKREPMIVQKPEAICSQMGIIKSEQYSKTNENEDGNETETEAEITEAEMKVEDEKPAMHGRVLLGRSVSYTLSCHIDARKQPGTITPNNTDGIDNIHEETIKNSEQLTITSADDSSNALKVVSAQQRREEGKTAEGTEVTNAWRRTVIDRSGYKADTENGDEGVVNAVDADDGNGNDENYEAGSADGSEESDDENYTAAYDELDDAPDGDGDVDFDIDGGPGNNAE